MAKTVKKVLSVFLTLTLVISLCSVSFSANAKETEKVKVIVRNDVFSVEDGASWDGVLVDEWVEIDENSTMMSAVVSALTNNGYSQSGAENNYISEINGLSEFDGGFMSGWMGTLNDWFTNQGFSAYTVADGTLENGDEISIMYTCEYGGDIGGSWYDNFTTLNNIDFNVGEISPNFTPENLSYTLNLPAGTENIMVTPTATNKNFQVRTYLNDYTPNIDGSEIKRTQDISVKNNDVIYVGVGDSNWPSMNGVAEGNVYEFKIQIEEKPINSCGKVKITVSNDVFSVDDGASWDGVLVDEWVEIDENSTAISALVTVLDKYGYSQTGAESNYITEINGLSAYDASYMSGWMGTINDWFANEGFGAFTVKNGNLTDGDEIAFMFTDMWGMDIGSDWSDDTTALALVDFSVGELSQEFEYDVTDYTLYVPQNTNSIKVTPTAWNKNYQVRTYKNSYTPSVDGSEYKRNAEISVADNDTIYIGVGDTNWPSMNYSAGGTVYSFKIKYLRENDVNLDGVVDIDDVTTLQLYLAKMVDINEIQLNLADINNDGIVNIDDATKLQMILAGCNE